MTDTRRWTQSYEDEIVRWARATRKCTTDEHEAEIRQTIKDNTWHGRYDWPIRTSL